MKQILVLITLGMGVMFAVGADNPAKASTTLPQTAFQEATSFEMALREAEKSHKIVFVDFYTTWCGPCKLMDQETWNDPSLIALLKEKTIALKVDAEQEMALAKRYNVTQYPTLAFIRPDGTLIDSLVGYRDASTFSVELKDALAGKTKLAQAREAVAKAGTDSEQRVQARFDLARELAQKGMDAEALTEFLWCFDVGMKKPSPFEGVRLSYLVSDIARLGMHYPAAMDELRTRRDRDQKILASDSEAAAEFGALNDALGQESLTLEAFDQFPSGSTQRAAFGHWVFDQLLDARRYLDATDAIPFPKCMALFTRLSSSPNQRDSLRSFLSDYAAKELEALAGAGKLDDARVLLKALLGYDHSEATLSGIRRHLERAGHLELMPAPDHDAPSNRP